MTRRVKVYALVGVCLVAFGCAVYLLNGQAREFPETFARDITASSRASYAPQAQKPMARGGQGMAAMTGQTPESGQAEPSEGGQVTLAAVQVSQPDRYLIRNASISVETKDPRGAYDRLLEPVRLQHGYIGNMQIQVDALGTHVVTAEIRVPSDHFDEMMRSIEKLGKLLGENTKSDDVTEEYTDAEARLRNQKVTEIRLLGHLSGSTRLADTLAVEREVSRVRLEIERISGRLRYLSHRIEFSTIALTLQEAPRAGSMVPPETYSTGKVAGEASRSLIGFLQSVWSVVVWLAVWSPVWLVCGGVFWVVVRRYVRTVGSPP